MNIMEVLDDWEKSISSAPYKHVAVVPWDRGDYQRRVSTFTPWVWFGKMSIVSKEICASNGWECCGKDEVTCKHCNSKLVFDILGSEKEYSYKFKSLIASDGHNDVCPFRLSPYISTKLLSSSEKPVDANSLDQYMDELVGI